MLNNSHPSFFVLVDFSALKGLTFKKIENESNELVFLTEDGKTYVMGHMQQCCERVHLEDVCGDLEDLLGSPIVEAEQSSSPNLATENSWVTRWTFYRISTVKGTVTLRWIGDSNGYYSTAVGTYQLETEEEAY